MAFSRPAPQDATQAEMEAGTEASVRTVSPLLVAQAIAALGGGGGASAIDDLSDVTITAADSGDFLRHNGAAWVDATISASDLPSGIDATKIGEGAVSSAEFGYLTGATSAIQTQLDGKAGTSTIAGFSKPVYEVNSNVWLGPPGLTHTGAPLSPNVIYAVRIFVAATRTFTKLRCAVGVAWSAGSTLRMAIANETASCLPGTLILDSGTIAADSTGFKDFTISQSLSPGWYWILWSTDGTGGQISAGTATSTPNGVLTSSATSSGNIQFLSRSLTYAAYDDQTGATWTATFNGNPPRLLIQ